MENKEYPCKDPLCMYCYHQQESNYPNYNYFYIIIDAKDRYQISLETY